MRPLKRPMFKTGGPIKEGVMNGLRDGGVATTMADATMMAGGGMPNMRGRVTGPGGYAGKKKRSFFKPTLGGVTGSVGLDYYVDPQPYLDLLQAIQGVPFKEGGPVGPGLVGDPRYPQQGGRAMHNEYLKNIYQKATPIVKGFFSPKKYVKRAKAVQKIAGNVPGMLKSAVQQAGPGIMSTRQALIKNLKDFNVPYGSKIKDFAVAAGQKALKYPKTSAVGALGLTSDTARDVYGAIGDAGKSIAGNLTPGWLQRLFTPTPKEPPPPPPPGGTGRHRRSNKAVIPKVKTQAEIDAEKAADDKKKLDRIYSLLGVKRAQANAASKALIDMSRYIDEGGRDVISKKNIGSTISKAIGAFDKRLDKADQLKEAAGLMMAKGEIEAMSDPNKKKLQNLQIELGEDKLRPGVNSTLISSRTIKKGALTEQETIDAVRIGAANEGSELLGSITSDQIDDGNYKGKTVIDIVTDLKPEKNGYFVIGKSIVKVESGVPKLISGPLAID
jgi:hypothetical protein